MGHLPDHHQAGGALRWWLPVLGEGSQGSEGFFAWLGPDHDLLWAVYLEESNPIVDIAVTGDRAVIRSTADVTVVLDSGSESFWPVA